MAETFVGVVRDEAEHIVAEAERKEELDWAVFADGWFRVVFGDGVRRSRADTPDQCITK